MSWTDERVEKLKQLWADGLSASQIAAQIGGISRNAVIGKVHRLSLPGRAKSGGSSASRSKRTAGGSHASGFAGRSGATRTVMRSSGATALKPQFIADAVEDIDRRAIEDIVLPISRRLPLTELTEKTCKWPIGDPLQEDFHFCGNDSSDSGPYCNYHAKLAFQPAGERRRK